MSSFFIFNIACSAAAEFPDLPSDSICMSTLGTTCHETPNRSLSQPHGPSSPPPSMSFVQYRSISSCVSQLTISEMPSLNLNVGPPSNARNSLPSSSKVAPSTLPSSLRWMLSTFELRSEEHTSEFQSRFDLVCRL